jgi:hypothetical protein
MESSHNIKTHISNVFIIGGVNLGGSFKFINDLKNAYPKCIHITNYKDIKYRVFSSNDILLVQHLLKDITPILIYNIKKKYDCRIIINIHDFIYLNNKSKTKNVHNLYLLKDNYVDADIKRLFDIAEIVIHPSKFTYDIYSKYFKPTNFCISPHIDYKKLDSVISVPNIKNKEIIIGVLSTHCICKGKELVEHLAKNITNYNGYDIVYKIVGANIPYYNEIEFFEYLDKYNIHGLLLLNVWGETYCYALSKFLKSGLPILYNNIGSFKERIPNSPQFFKVFDDEHDIDINNPIIQNMFYNLLDFIMINHGLNQKSKEETDLQVPILYRNLFTIEKCNPHSVKNLIILSSAIKTGGVPLSYTKTRSYFTEAERYEQTIKNIEILRCKIPDCAIILVDSTDMAKDYKTHLDKIRISIYF